jgi:hypothetical protein
MWKLSLFFVVATVATTACSSSTTADPDLDAWTREVRVLTPAQVGDRRFDEIGVLEEEEPVGYQGEERAAAAAKERLRRAAARLDADAVVILECERHARSMDEMDRRSLEAAVVCRGVAIRWTSF